MLPKKPRIPPAHKSFGEKRVGKSKKSKSGSLDPAKTIKSEEKIKATRKMLLDMKEKLPAEGDGKSLPEDLARRR